MTRPATPRPAATIILLRRGGKHSERAVEALLVRRNPAARFMPGVWVFPGGVVEESERAGDREGGPSDEQEERAHRACAVRELQEEAGIVLPEDAELRPWSRWITPEAVPIRFDTRFYVALAPPHSPPRADGEETVDAGWFTPRRALDMHAAGELELVFPTIKHLESLLPYATSDEVLEAVGHRVEPVLPKVIGEGEEQRIVLPGDPGY
ncbi:MAG TPA: NUDIX hydrolase [Solirubrobacterales bacterium]|nr:NUDIX hydrolase [Solirubrobacterales bacterium]